MSEKMSNIIESNFWLIFTLSIRPWDEVPLPAISWTPPRLVNLPTAWAACSNLDNPFHEEILLDVLGQSSAYHVWHNNHASVMHSAITHSASAQHKPKPQQSDTQTVHSTSLHPHPPRVVYKTEMCASRLFYKPPLPWLRKSGSSLNHVDLIARDHVNVVLLLSLRLSRKFNGENLQQCSCNNAD